MRRWIAVFMTACLSLQTWTYADTPVSAAGTTAVQSEETKETVSRAVSEGISQTECALEVEVRSSLLFPFQGNVTVKISSNKTEKQQKVLDFKNTDGSSQTARFDVPEGNYSVSVQADRFAGYSQTAAVKRGWISKVQVCPVRTETGSSAVPGWIRPGDFNGDKVIDSKDTDIVLSTLRKNPGSAAADLNGDGSTDLVDLQNLVQSIDENQVSHVEKLGLPRKVQASGETTVEGSILNFMNGEGDITLRPFDRESAISKDNPAGLEFTLADQHVPTPEIQGITIHAPMEEKDGTITSGIADGEAVVVCEDGKGGEQETVFSLSDGQAAAKTGIRRMSRADGTKVSAASLSVDASGTLVLDFGMQLAVKRVVIRITGTKKTEPLINIAKVEFVNNMEDRIPAPQLDIPTVNIPVSGNESLTVSWSAQRNITGYEVYVSSQATGESQILRVANTKHLITSINDKELKNFETYRIKVRSVNGDWKSPWSKEVTGVPKPQKLPAGPDHVKAEGGYRSITVSWKDMDDASGYMVFFRKSTDTDAAYEPVVKGFQPVRAGTGRLEGTKYVISGLEDNTEYSVYVTGWNELGWGNASLVSKAFTKNTAPPQLPKYHLLNTSRGEGVLTAHIQDAVYGGSGGARMVGSPLDTTANSALGLVDDNYGSYWTKTDWDDGVAYPAASKGMVVTLDNNYKMNYMTFAAADMKTGVNTVRVGYWSKEDKQEQTVGARLIAKTDAGNNPYYIVKFDRTITADRIHLCLGRSWGGAGDIVVGEIHFHKYDSLEDDIMGLYQDDMHTTLREDVTASVIDALERRLETADTESGEKHPLYQELKLECKTAREILTSALEPARRVENQITAAKDTHLGFGGLNSWQPLGKAAYAGESLLVYVGHNTKRTGDAAALKLVVTQHHAESSAVMKTMDLKVGRNEITIPQITTTDQERGGQLYISYTGNDAADQYAVRISGGSSIPVLSVYGKTGAARTEAIQAYVKELETHVKTLEESHSRQHTGTKNVDYPYDKTNCILNATDIMMKEMMYSLPAEQVWAGMAGAEDKAAKLDQALQAMEKTMTLFYQHKGLSDSAGTGRGKNALPSQHLNIRYMRMFAGAFMYAAGNHIGIEWNSATLASAPSDWSGFGWGVAHEIGHNINQGSYAVAEVTNNYFAQLLTKTPGRTRFDYAKVYEKVTSGTVGRSSNVATQLALYWQLHLAYDDNPEDKYIYDNYEDQFNNLFFARVDTYARNPARAPQEGLKLNGGADQNLMRLACAAAEKNILPFFQRWGMEPDAATITYARKYGDAETKALYYVNDAARDYRAAHPGETGTVKDQDAVQASAAARGGQVEITIRTDRDEDLILGYEISRSMISNGKKKTEVVGFQPVDTAARTIYTDTIYSINNRVMEYEVRAVDKYLNYSRPAAAGSTKIQTDGILDKTEWTVETDMTSADDIVMEPDTDDPDSGYHADRPDSTEAKRVHSIDRILDGDRTETGTYHGTSKGTAVITIDMHRTEQVTALKYLGDSLAEVTIEVSQDGAEWTAVKENVRGLGGSAEKTIWFDSVKEGERDHWIGTYDARYVRLAISHTGNIAVREIELCGPTGDNVEFMEAESGQPAIGVLTADYKYGSQASDVIKKGSLIFTGTYKGNPAYNVVVLYDTEGSVIGAKDGETQSGQVIFASVPAQGNLGETSEGTWVYYVEPGQWDAAALQKLQGVRAELYRVDDALTLEGERIVSDTQMISIPHQIPNITLTNGGRSEKVD